jgi:hypothetical protein
MNGHLEQVKDETIELKPIDATGVKQDDDAPTALDGVVDNVTMSNDIIPAKAFLVEDKGEDNKGTGSDSDDSMGDLNSMEAAGIVDFAMEDLEAGTGTKNVASSRPPEQNTSNQDPCCRILIYLWACIVIWRAIVGIHAAAH